MAKGKELKNPKNTGGVKVELGDRKEVLKFDLNSFAELEDEYGSIEDAMGEMEKGTMKGIRTMLWAALIHSYCDEDGEPTITPRQVGSWIDLKDMQYLGEKIGEALKQALPEDAMEEMDTSALEEKAAQAAGTSGKGKGKGQEKK